MAVDRVESLRAYRAVLQRRFDQESRVGLEKVPGGEWDGMEVLRRQTLEEVIHRIAEADPEPVADVAELRTPGRVFVDAICPRCHLETRVLLLVSTNLVQTDAGTSTIEVKSKAKAQSHVCGQRSLEAVELEAEEQMRLADLVGPTEPTLVLRTDMPRPDDVTVDRPADERCGAETIIPSGIEGDEEETLVCERLLDHDDAANVTVLGEDAREHWAEGGFGWHFEDRPVPRDAVGFAEIEGDDEDGNEPGNTLADEEEDE